MRKEKMNTDLVRQLIYAGYNDKEVGDRVNRSKNTIRNFRVYKLKIYRDDIFFMRDWRRVIWRKYKYKSSVDALILTIPLKYTRDMFPDRTELCFSIRRQMPNRLIIEFKKEEDIIDKSLIRRRRRLRSDIAI